MRPLPTRSAAPAPRSNPRGRAARAGAIVALLFVASLTAALVGRGAPSRAAMTAPRAASSTSAPAAPNAAPPGDETSWLHGRILDADGHPVPGAAVRVVSPRRPYTVVSETTSGAGGAFSFARAPPGLVRVVAARDPEGVVSSAPLRAVARVSLDVTLVLSAARVVCGTVVDDADSPIAGATLSADGVPWAAPAATTGDGAFCLPALPDEATSLVAGARGYRSARVPLPPRAQGAEPAVSVRLAAASPVEGDTRDADGEPVAARLVACEGEPFETRVASADDGTFTLPPETIGCRVIAEHDELAPSDPVDVVENRRLALRLHAGGSIEARVVDDRGAPVRSFTVGVEAFYAARDRAYRSGGRREVEDARGALSWDRLAPGSYVLSVSAPGMTPSRSGTIEVTSAATTRGVRLVLSRGGTVTGHVYDDHHAPLAGVALRFEQLASAVDGGATASTDAAGAYRLEGAPAGPFALSARKGGFRGRLVSGLRTDPRGALTQDIALTGSTKVREVEYAGIGAMLQVGAMGVELIDVAAGGAAARAGLEAGDVLTRVDGEEIVSVADASQRLGGAAGTSVGVSVRRGAGEAIDAVLVRETAVVSLPFKAVALRR